MSSTERVVERTRRRLVRYDNVHKADIDVIFRDGRATASVGFYFESLRDGSEENVPTLDEWRASSIVVIDGRVMEWTLHLPLVYPPFDMDAIEEAWDASYEEASPTAYPMLFYAEAYDGVAVPHVDTPECVWSDESVAFSVAEFFDTLDAVLREFSGRVYERNPFGLS